MGIGLPRPLWCYPQWWNQLQGSGRGIIGGELNTKVAAGKCILSALENVSGIKNLLNSDTGDSMRGGGLARPPMSPTAAAGHDFALSSPGGALVALPWLPGSPPTGFPAGGWPGTSEPEGMLEGV